MSKANPFDEDDKTQASTPPVSMKTKTSVPVWSRRAAALKKTGTTPRDFYEHDPFFVTAPPEVMKNVRFWWASDIILRRRPMLSGFMYDIYEPVTPEFMAENKVRVGTKDRTPDGVPRAGSDATLYWAPEEIARQQNEYWEEQSRLGLRKAQQEAEEFKERASVDPSGVVSAIGGGLQMLNDPREIAEAEARERADTKNVKQIDDL